ncbi:MAG: phage tail tip lysozyme [Lachnospiraceae bacterium]|nr:phage tail tip lysozyme [Lachnospiraceae bacterium]
MGERSKWRVGFLLCAMLLLLGVVPVQAAAKKNLAKANIKLGTTSYTYNGKKRTPKVTVKYGKKTLKKNRDYTVSYRNNQYTGKATVQIKGKGSYQGTRKLSFTIRAGKMITVKLNSCGGEALQSLERPHGGTYGALPEPVKEGYSFQGWYTAKSGGKQVNSGTRVIGKKNRTLYAHWLKGSNTEIVWKALRRAGYSEQATAGIIGNLMFESGGYPDDIKTNAIEYKSGEGIGMVQWSYVRKTRFRQYLRSHGESWPSHNISLQISYMLYELEHGEWAWIGISQKYGAKYDVTLQEFKQCRDVAFATRAFCAKFERCHYKDAHLKERTAGAKWAYQKYHSQ